MLEGINVELPTKIKFVLLPVHLASKSGPSWMNITEQSRQPSIAGQS